MSFKFQKHFCFILDWSWIEKLKENCLFFINVALPPVLLAHSSASPELIALTKQIKIFQQETRKKGRGECRDGQKSKNKSSKRRGGKKIQIQRFNSFEERRERRCGKLYSSFFHLLYSPSLAHTASLRLATLAHPFTLNWFTKKKIKSSKRRQIKLRGWLSHSFFFFFSGKTRKNVIRKRTRRTTKAEKYKMAKWQRERRTRSKGQRRWIISLDLN